MKKIVFPDSSVFLHYSPLDEIDLPKLFDCAEVEVLLTVVVTDELLRHQGQHPGPELRQRAEEAVQRVEKWLEGQRAISPGVTVNFLGRGPDSEIMERFHLNWQHHGDTLLGMLLEHQQARPDEAISLLTGDTDLASRARSLGIEAATLSNEFTLAEAANRLPEAKRETRRQLARFRYRAPSLSLSFAGGKDEIEVSMAPQLDSLTPTMRAKLVAVTNKMHREAAQRQADVEFEAMLDDLDTLAALAAQASAAGGHSVLDGITEQEAEWYKREIEAYPGKFERYLHRCLEMINEHRRTIRLDLEMENAGGTSAENVLLVLTLPEQLEWHLRPSDRDMPAPPIPPTRAEPESQVQERGYHIVDVSSVPSDLLDRDYISGDEPAGASPVISEAGTELQWELGTYRHHQSRLLEPLYVRFRLADDVPNFTIGWEIQEKNSSASMRGQLLVSIDKMMSAGKADG